ncbi:MAG TPA: hypothetical protein VFS67_35765 [Polyangiaceae bacterium]|nr:hypothetical protein [Polyangiaceae bacterium]
MPLNTVAIVQGRLLEIRADAGYRSLQDVEQVTRAIQRESMKVPLNLRAVTVVDWRRCPVMSDDASARLLEHMRSTNPRVERSAALASQKSSIAVLQFLRLVRESSHRDRRLFFEPEPLIEWLGEVLTPEELQRLREFLAEGAPASP